MDTMYAKAADILPQDKNDFLEHLTPAIMSHELDGDRLSKCPHVDVPGTDLAIVARYSPPGEDITALVNNGVAQMYHLTGAEIIHHATSVMGKDSYQIDSLGSVLGALLGEDMASVMTAAAPPEVLVLRSEKTDFGAVEMINPAAMAAAHDRLGMDFFIIPSSKFETLLVPKGEGVDAESLQSMVREVNSSVVSPGDQLSNGLYQYNGANMTISYAHTETKTETAQHIQGQNRGR